MTECYQLYLQTMDCSLIGETVHNHYDNIYGLSCPGLGLRDTLIHQYQVTDTRKKLYNHYDNIYGPSCPGLGLKDTLIHQYHSDWHKEETVQSLW